MFAANSFLGNGFTSFGGYGQGYSQGFSQGYAQPTATPTYNVGGYNTAAAYGQTAAYNPTAYNPYGAGTVSYGAPAVNYGATYANVGGYSGYSSGYGDYSSPYNVYGNAGSIAGLAGGAIFNGGANVISQQLGAVAAPIYGAAGVQNPNAGYKPTIKPPKVNLTAALTSPERVERLLEGAFSKLEALGNQIRNAAVEFDELRTEVVSANNICDSELRTQLQEANDEIERLRSQLQECAARKASARQMQMMPQVMMVQQEPVVVEEALEVEEDGGELEPVIVTDM